MLTKIQSKAIVFIGLILVVAPSVVKASGFVPCGRDPQGADRCTLCHFLVSANLIKNFITETLFVVGVTVLTIAGIVYIVSAGNQQLTTLAKSAIKNVFLGLIFILAAWVLITFVFVMLARGGNVEEATGKFTSGGNLWSFTCNPTVAPLSN